MKIITFNDKQLSILLEAIRISLTYTEAGDKLYLISNFQQCFDDESQISSFTYGLNHPSTQDIEGYLDNLLKGMANYLNKVGLPKDLVEEITNIDNDHLMIVSNKNDSLQIHFNDATITCILHLTGQW